MTFKYNVLFILVFTTFLVNLFIFNVIQTKPYMDEEIHMEQAQNYCKGYLFRYDPRISTPPGLYVWPWLLSVLTRFLPVAGLDSFICGTLFLRLISSCFAILLWFELKNWSRLSRRKISPTQLLSLWTHAIVFFYYFFYYTDVPSLYFGLLCLRYSYKCSPIIAALFGSLSTFHRQTSVIYHFISCLILTSGLWSQSLDFRSSSIFACLYKLFGNLFHKPVAYFRLCWPHLVCFAVYAVWLTQRGTVAVGHAQHHRLIFHPMMILYFLCYELAFYPPSVSLVARFFRSLVRYPLYWLSMSIVFFIFIRNCVYIHPFLLSDRRHYTFLFVRLLYQKTKYLKYAMIPCGLVSAYHIEEKLRKLDILERIYLMVLVCFPYVFIPLLELRYFIPSHIIIHLTHLVFASAKLEENKGGEQKLDTMNIVDSDDVAFYRCTWNILCVVALFVVFYCFPLNYWNRDDGFKLQTIFSLLRSDCSNCTLERLMP